MEIEKNNQRLITLTLQERAAQAVSGTEDPWPAILERLNAIPADPGRARKARPRASGQSENPGWRLGRLPGTLFRGTPTKRGSGFVLSAGILTICMVVIAVMVVLPALDRDMRSLTPAELLQKAAAANSFVPAGKVRHEVFSDTERLSGSSLVTTTIREIWIGNGKNHALMRENTGQKGDYVLIGENTFWTYNPSLAPTIVYTYPYDPRQLKFYVPNSRLISEMQQEIGAYTVGNSTIEGRPTLLMERTYHITPGSSVNPDTGGVQQYRFWIDTNTYQVLQDERDIRESANGTYTNHVATFVSTMVLDELLDENKVPSDLFSFVQPPGTLVIPGRNMTWGP